MHITKKEKHMKKHDTLPGVMIDVGKIKQHPDNPRKDLGDLEELAESIRKNGIMQNLTVIPEDEENENNDTYIVLIGHRRLAAAKEAHLFEVPCNIVFGLSKKEQIAIMLEENMQRSDLTPIEQAFGFQMMLDLGETEESIAEKTGFSRTTVHHRLQIAKLDKRILKESEEFQLSLGDLMALEQIRSIARRNAVLGLAKSSEELRSKAAMEALSEKRAEAEEKLIPMLESMGIKKMPEKLQSKIWTSDLRRLKGISLDEKIPEELDIDTGTKEEPVYYHPQFGREILIYQKVKKEKKEPSEYELFQNQIKANREHLKGIMKKLADERNTHVKAMLNGTAARIQASAENWEKMFTLMYEKDTYMSVSVDGIRRLLLGKHDWQISQEEKDSIDPQIEKMTQIEKMLALTELSIEEEYPFTGYGALTFQEHKAKRIETWHDILRPYGFTVTDEETIQVLNGTHELYGEEKE